MNQRGFDVLLAGSSSSFAVTGLARTLQGVGDSLPPGTMASAL